MTVYIDILLLENIAINLVILGITAYFARAKVGGFRLLFGALIGAMAVFIAFIPNFSFNVLFKVVFSFALIAVTFWPKTIKEFARFTAIFYLVCFAFGGAAFALFYFLKTNPYFYNGAFYIEYYPVKTLIISSIIAYIVIVVSWNFVRNKIVQEQLLTNIFLKMKDVIVELKAFVDTGNSLKDPISKLPVVVVEYGAIKSILPDKVCEVFDQEGKDELEILSEIEQDSEWLNRLRVIPFRSLGNENGMLIGFKPDEFMVYGEESNNLIDVIVGIYNKTLSQDGTYQALMAFELTNYEKVG